MGAWAGWRKAQKSEFSFDIWQMKGKVGKLKEIGGRGWAPEAPRGNRELAKKIK